MIQQLFFVALLVLMSWLPGSAFAYGTVAANTVMYISQSAHGGASPGNFSTTDAACAATMADWAPIQSYTVSMPGPLCNLHWTSGSNWSYGIGSTGSAGCPANSHLTGGACVVDLGYQAPATGNTPISYSCGAAGSYSSVASADIIATGIGDQQCKDGCMTSSRIKVGEDGQIWATWPFVSLGTTSFCGGGAGASLPTAAPKDLTGTSYGDAAPVPCGVNQCPGTVNGVLRCVACQTGVGISVSTTAPIVDTATGSQQQTTTTTSCAVSGACTSTSVVSTTIVSGGGTFGVGGTKTTTTTTGPTTVTDRTSFCLTNPNETICGGAGTGTGGGGGGSPGGGTGAAPGPAGAASSPPADGASDSSLPGQPGLYTRKYTGGLSDVWATQKTALLATPLISLTSSMMPTIVGSGGYPTWTVPLSIGVHNWGTFDVSLPGYIWDFIKICIMIGALFLSRALIFGG